MYFRINILITVKPLHGLCINVKNAHISENETAIIFIRYEYMDVFNMQG